MKKVLVVISAVAMLLATSSCYRHHVCATYVKAEKPQVETTVVDENM